MRAALGCGLLLLAACQARENPEKPAADTAARVADNTIECALDGATRFERVCEVEKARVEDTLFLTVRHPDGGFRRFEVLKDGHGLAVADGADGASLTMQGGVLEAAVGNDRYRFPVTLKDSDATR